ncbi:lytic transglycosylase domain-containing protein [Lacimicrobium alkaliphilum]|uniref:Lytic transglycosylase n=1 Tax=Lacimicrobium alkaliphilum TaxID=1526571 RepID=A0ABQ1RQR3_9ALTE|nr:lytic transglycosylase domain-containing protein [Lacimicrobium alkaliphilum]GGD76226.1 lytic transglycosylase [Lacimicrobium alkaliphilum]
MFNSRILIVLFSLCFIPLVQATQDSYVQQRELFLEAEKWSHYPNSETYRKLASQLEDYPLYPYLHQNALLADLRLGNEAEIAQFLGEHTNTPLDGELREKWLYYLSKRGDGARFIQYYQDLGNTELQCLNAKYHLARNKPQGLALVSELWLAGKSQPKACDAVFKAWTEAGHRSEWMVWQRLVLAANGGDHTLIPYLKSLLDKKQQYLADLWYKARRNPAMVSRLSAFPGKFPEKEQQIISYGLKRMAWRDHALALKTWHDAQKRFNFNAGEQQEIAERFAIALAVDNHPQAGFWLEKANQGQNNEAIFRWHLTHTLRQQNWQKVIDVIEHSPQMLESDYSSRYWLGRSYESLNAPVQAQREYDKLSSVRHYYGFLASGKLARPAQLADTPLELDASLLDQVADLPAAKRAKEFLALERYVSARREWIKLQPRLTHEQGLAAAVLADRWGWHDQAIFALSRLGYLDDVKRRFPLAYDAQMQQSANKNAVDPAWAFAIARRESSFMRDANSGAGAKGLMQLMPGTAQYLAKKKVSASALFDAGQNVEFGTRYMRYLLDKMHDNPVLATAAYNAGWSRVNQWLPEEEVPADLWVETIPYKETRNYVKAVMAYQQIYKQRLGQQQNLFEQLTDMRISSRMAAK